MSEEQVPISKDGRDLAPAVFSDGVLNLAVGAGVVKFYLVRDDPAVGEVLGNERKLVAQVIMPLEVFAATAVFFQERLEFLVKSGSIGQDRVDFMNNEVRK